MAKEKTDAKSKSAEPKSKSADGAEQPAKQKKNPKLLVIIVALTVLLAGGGGAAWYFLHGSADEKPVEGKQAAAPKPKDEKAKPAVFVTLEVFTVNLQPEGGDHLLQTTLSLKVSDAAVEQAIKQLMPEIRSRLLLLLSSKRPSELTTVEGKQELANQIAAEVNQTLNPSAAKKPAVAADAKPAADGKPAAEARPAPAPPAGPVLSVFFSSFIIQRS